MVVTFAPKTKVQVEILIAESNEFFKRIFQEKLSANLKDFEENLAYTKSYKEAQDQYNASKQYKSKLD